MHIKLVCKDRLIYSTVRFFRAVDYYYYYCSNHLIVSQSISVHFKIIVKSIMRPECMNRLFLKENNHLKEKTRILMQNKEKYSLILSGIGRGQSYIERQVPDRLLPDNPFINETNPTLITAKTQTEPTKMDFAEKKGKKCWCEHLTCPKYIFKEDGSFECEEYVCKNEICHD